MPFQTRIEASFLDYIPPMASEVELKRVHALCAETLAATEAHVEALRHPAAADGGPSYVMARNCIAEMGWFVSTMPPLTSQFLHQRCYSAVDNWRAINMHSKQHTLRERDAANSLYALSQIYTDIRHAHPDGVGAKKAPSLSCCKILSNVAFMLFAMALMRFLSVIPQQ